MGEPKLQVEYQGHIWNWWDLELITVWGSTPEWLKPTAKWSPKQGGRPKCGELRPIECLILVQSWKTKEARVVPQSTGCNKGRRPNHQSKGPQKNSVKRRTGANSKVEAEMRAGGMQGSRGWIELCSPIATWEADPRAKAEWRKGHQNELGDQTLSQASGSPHICFLKSSKNCKASPSVWCQIHHTGVTLITEQQLRVLPSPKIQPL